MFFTLSDALFDLLLLFHLRIITLAIITYTFQRIHGKNSRNLSVVNCLFFMIFYFFNKAIELESVLPMMVIIVPDRVTPL